MRTTTLLSLLSLLWLAGCQAATEPAATTPGTTATPPAATAPVPDAARPPPKELLNVGGVDYACRTAADCEVKNVGNCCGYYPSCVNTASPTFPEQVKAECEKQGAMSICGFPQIVGCDCVEGRCSNITGPGAGAQVQ